MGFSGLRPATIGNAEGTDGLKLGDLPEVEIRGGEVSFAKVPASVVVRKKISKIRASFVTFAPAQACEYLRQYFEDGPDSAVVTVTEFNRQTRRSGEGVSTLDFCAPLWYAISMLATSVYGIVTAHRGIFMLQPA